MDIIRTLNVSFTNFTVLTFDKFLVQVKKPWCYVDARVKHGNLVSSNELIKVEIPP